MKLNMYLKNIIIQMNSQNFMHGLHQNQQIIKD